MATTGGEGGGRGDVRQEDGSEPPGDKLRMAMPSPVLYPGGAPGVHLRAGAGAGMSKDTGGRVEYFDLQQPIRAATCSKSANRKENGFRRP
jgi:hypothetical protein